VAILCLALGVAGCGLKARSGAGAVTVTITRDFGSQQLQTFTRSVHGAELATAVTTDAARGSLFVNGVNQSLPTKAKVYAGDRVWVDLQPTSGNVRAAVGSFPEPFVHGIGGKRLPVTIECGADVAAACRRVAGSLADAGISAASQLLGTGSGQDTLGVVVGTADDIRGSIAAGLIARGPSLSGVFARLGGGGLELLDQHGRVARTLRAGSGLIAATADSQSAPVWLITGTDVAGVNAAAGALTAARLRHHFALAIDGSTDVPLPAVGSR
jgi:hypothetical protein